MLQERKNKTLSPDCIKLMLIVIGIVVGFGVYFTWIIIFFYFSYEKNLRKIKVLSIGDILRISGLMGCLNNLLSNTGINRDDLQDDYKKVKEKFRETIYNKKSKNSVNKNYDDNFKKLTSSIKSYSKIKTKSYSTKTNFSNKYNSFNDGKSIWDDYESVIDIMNKK